MLPHSRSTIVWMNCKLTDSHKEAVNHSWMIRKYRILMIIFLIQCLWKNIMIIMYYQLQYYLYYNYNIMVIPLIIMLKLIQNKWNIMDMINAMGQFDSHCVAIDLCARRHWILVMSLLIYIRLFIIIDNCALNVPHIIYILYQYYVMLCD